MMQTVFSISTSRQASSALARAARALGLAALCLALAAPEARAQERIMSGSADLADPAALFANPALLSFHPARVSLSAKAYHVGFDPNQGGLPYRQSFLTLSTPYVFGRRLGAGLAVQSFGSPVFYRTTAAAQLAYRVRRDVAIGVELGAINLAYNQDNFDLIDPDDPVFANGASKTVPVVSVGAYAQPTEWLGASLGVRTLNAPNLALGAGTVRAHRTVFAGAQFRVRPVSVLVDLTYDGRYFTPRAYVGVGAQNGHYARFSTGFGDVASPRFEGQLRIGGPLLVHYSYDIAPVEFQGLSDGSHRFTLTYELRRDRLRIPRRAVADPLDLDYAPGFEESDVQPRVHMLAASDYVAVYETEVIREIDPRVSDAALAALSPSDLGMGPLDSLNLPVGPPPGGEVVPSGRAGIPFNTSISPEYRASLDALGREAQRDGSDTLQIVSEEPVLNRALGVRDRIARSDSARARVQVQTLRYASAADSVRQTRRIRSRADIPTRSTYVSLEPAQADIYLYPSEPEVAAAERWTFVVESTRTNAVVARKSGSGAIPATLTWDWRDDDGSVVEAGVYRYYVTWTNASGETRRTNTRRLFVQTFRRVSTIEVRATPRETPADADDVKLLIRN